MNSRPDKLKLFTLLACLIPFLWLLFDIAYNQLGANPIQALHIRLGDWALLFLCLTLAISPVQTLFKLRGLSYYRQLFGLYTFFYATLHVLGYLIVDHYFEWQLIGIDIIESTYIWFGVLAYVILFLLAITSSNWSKIQLGKYWKKLHRFIYLAAGAAILHYFLQLKSNLAEPLFYLVIIAILLSFRIL